VPLVLAGSGGGCFGSAGLEVPAALSAVLLRYCLGRVCGVLVPFVPGCALGKLRAGRSDVAPVHYLVALLLHHVSGGMPGIDSGLTTDPELRNQNSQRDPVRSPRWETG